MDIILTKQANKPTKQRVILVAILFITLLFSYFDRINISVLMADNAFLTDLGIKGDTVKMGLLMSVYLIAYATANIFLSPMGDFLGPRKAISLCLPVWAISMFVGGFAQTFMWMIVARVLLGIGEGVHWPVQMKYVKNWFPPQERGKANSAWQFGIFIGPALAMPFFTWLISSVGWRDSFFVLAVSTLVPMVLIWFFTTDSPREHKGVNQAELEYIENGLRMESEGKTEVASLSFKESVKLFIFNYRYWLLVAYFFCNASGMWGIFAWLPSYLKVARGFSWAQMGALASLPYAAGAVSLFIFGYLTDKVGRRAPFCALGMLGMSAGIYFAAHATDNLTSAYLLAFAVAANAVALPATWSLCQEIVPSRALGAGAGLMNGIGSAGGALAPIVIGYIISVTGSYIGGLMYLVALTFMAALCMLGLVIQKY